MTQSALAESAQQHLGGRTVSHAYISRIEAGVREPSIRILRALAAALNVSPDYLETGEERNGDKLTAQTRSELRDIADEITLLARRLVNIARRLI